MKGQIHFESPYQHHVGSYMALCLLKVKRLPTKTGCLCRKHVYNNFITKHLTYISTSQLQRKNIPHAYSLKNDYLNSQQFTNCMDEIHIEKQSNL